MAKYTHNAQLSNKAVLNNTYTQIHANHPHPHTHPHTIPPHRHACDAASAVSEGESFIRSLLTNDNIHTTDAGKKGHWVFLGPFLLPSAPRVAIEHWDFIRKHVCVQHQVLNSQIPPREA